MSPVGGEGVPGHSRRCPLMRWRGHRGPPWPMASRTQPASEPGAGEPPLRPPETRRFSGSLVGVACRAGGQ